MIEWSNNLFYNNLNYCRLHKLHSVKSYVLKKGVEIIFFKKADKILTFLFLML